jgi:hypothetical protein
MTMTETLKQLELLSDKPKLSDEFRLRVELEALITERSGMIMHNVARDSEQKALAYDHDAFFELAERMRGLLNPERTKDG